MDVTYDRRADVLSIRLRDGQPKYVAVGRGTFVIFADDGGIWGIDLEAESWDSQDMETFKKMKIEILDVPNFDALNKLMPPRQMIPWPYITAEWSHS